jgi:hypothetical protein
MVAVTALISWVVGKAEAQTISGQRPQTVAETAKAIANTINATAPKTPGAAISFESATSHDNIVEMRYVANDAAVFVRLKSTIDQMRLAKTSYYCNESRVAYLRQGIVMREVIATSNNSDQIEFTFDKSSCDSLPKAKLADPKRLAELAAAVAKAENDTIAKPSKAPFQLNGPQHTKAL